MAQISIAVVSDTKQAAASVKQLSTEYSGLVEQLRLLGPDGATAADQLESSMKAAQIATQDAATASSQLVTDINKAKVAAAEQGIEFQTASQRIGQVGGAFEETGEKVSAGGKVAEGAVQNLAYSAGTIGEAFTGTGGALDSLGQFAAFLGPAFSGIPGLGLAAAAGVSVIGLALSALGQQMQITQQAVDESAQDIAKSLIDAGNDGSKGLDNASDALKTLATTGDDAGVTLRSLADEAKGSNVSFEDLAKSYTGNETTLKRMKAAIDANIKSLQEQQGGFHISPADLRASNEQIDTYKGINSQLDSQLSSLKEGKSEFKLWQKAGGEAAEEVATQIGKVSDALDTAATDSDDFFKNGKFDTQGYINQWLKLSQEIATASQDIDSSDLSNAAKSFLKDQAPQAQAEFINAYKNANPKQQAQLNSIWSANGKDSGTAYSKALQSSLPKNIAGPTITAKWKVDRSELDAAIAAQTNVVVPVSFSYAAGKKIE